MTISIEEKQMRNLKSLHDKRHEKRRNRRNVPQHNKGYI
jgi:hypothetical protein